jgi:hypothetical protein
MDAAVDDFRGYSAVSNLFIEVTTMNVRRLLALAGILAVAGAAWHQAHSADEPKTDPPAASDAASGDFATRYAQAQLRLAELRLRKAQDMNRRIPQTLAKGVIEQFSDDVAFAKAQIKAAQGSGRADSYSLWLARMELDLRDREEQLRVAVDANKRIGGAFSPIDLERMRAAIDLAGLRVERGRALAGASPDEKLQWQLEMTVEQINRINEMVTLSLQNRLGEFF